LRVLVFSPKSKGLLFMDENAGSWRELSQKYSTCAREFYEAVAKLGGHRQVDPKLVAHWQKIKELHSLCIPIEKQIDRHLGLEEEKQTGMDAHG